MQQTDLQTSDVIQLATGFEFVEGPVWHKDGYWLFSDIPSNRIHTVTPQGDVSIYREPADNSNGLTFDASGQLLACEHGSRRVSITTGNGQVSILADTFAGKRLNSPNDIVCHSSGAIYFTDPPYGITLDQMEQPCSGVYRLASDGITCVIDDFERPNGLAFAPDEAVLYIDDSHYEHIRAFDVAADGSLHNDRIFADLAHAQPGSPDGLKVDQAGNVYTTNALGIWVHNALGKFLGLIATPEVPANCAWGEDGQTLFITARTSVYTVRVRVPGIPVHQ